MDIRNVSGIQHLKFAVVTPENVAVSLHQHPDAAERFRAASPLKDILEVVELQDEIWWRQR